MHAPYCTNLLLWIMEDKEDKDNDQSGAPYF